MQSRASLVEDALARVLLRAYIAAIFADGERGDGKSTCESRVCADEAILREALFGNHPLIGQEQQK